LVVKICVIICKPKDVSLPQSILEAAFKRNDDGWGMMRLAGHGVKHRVIVDRGVSTSFEEFYKLYQAKYAAFQCAVHMRIKTHGEISEENCHPYKIMDDVYIMHNGTMSNAPTTNPAMSDTWHFAQLLKSVCNGDPTRLRDPSIQHLIHMAIGGSNKLVVLDKEGFLTFNHSAGKEHEGAWYSNDLSLPNRSFNSGYTYSNSSNTIWCSLVGKHVTPEEKVRIEFEQPLILQALKDSGYGQYMRDKWETDYPYSTVIRTYLQAGMASEIEAVYRNITIKDGKPMFGNEALTVNAPETEGETALVVGSKSLPEELTAAERDYVTSWQEALVAAHTQADNEKSEAGEVDLTRQSMDDMDCHGGVTVLRPQGGGTPPLDAPFRSVAIRDVPTEIDGWLELTLEEIKEINYNDPEAVAEAMYEVSSALNWATKMTKDEIVLKAYADPDAFAGALYAALLLVPETETEGVVCG
jgi:hypothetical protein